MNKIRLLFVALRIPADILAIALGVITSYYLRFNILPSLSTKLVVVEQLSLLEFINITVWFPFVAITALLFVGAYSTDQKQSLGKQIVHILIASGIWFMFTVSYYFLTRTLPFSRLATIYVTAFVTIYLIGGRTILTIALKHLLKKGYGKQKVLFLGYTTAIEKIIKKLTNNPEFELIGYLANEKAEEAQINYLGTPNEIRTISSQNSIDLLINNLGESTIKTSHLIELCRSKHLQYYAIPRALELYEYKFDFTTLQGVPALEWQNTTLKGWGRVIKRIFDLSIAIPAIIVLSPIFLIVAVLIKLDSKGTVFFRYLDDGKIAKRIGQKGELFYCYKFRTMHSNTHNQRYTELAEQNSRKGPLVKIQNDPRITRVGKWLRRYDIDEIPQLINVIKGDMSLIGPRPHLPEEVEQYKDNEKFVLSIKPGITGMAQVSGRSRLDFQDEVRLDSYYIEHWSLWLDIKILLKTIPVALQKTE